VEDVDATLPLYDGRHTVEMRAVNSVGAASPTMSATVEVSGVGPAQAYAASAPTLTSSETITVKLSAPAGASVQLSEDPFFSGARGLPAAPSVGWRLPPGDGAHTLYIRFRDASGLESPPQIKTVLLDRTPPTGRAIRHAGAAPWLELDARDSGSGVTAVQVVAGSGTAAAWQPFQSTLPLPRDAGDLQVRVRDAAGNISPPLTIVAGGPIYLPLAAR
jgi:hypothetical protein